MLRIMILDDDETYLEKAKIITEEYFSQKKLACTVETCGNTEWFLMDIKEKAYDLYLLGVDMPGKNGMDAAREIRKFYREPMIVFVSDNTEYAMEAYEVNAFRYISKSQLLPKLVDTYEIMLPKLLEKEEKYYVIEKKGVVEKLLYSDIYYLKKEGKYLHIVHKSGVSKERTTLTAAMEKLRPVGFMAIDKGYAVNLCHVMKLRNRELYVRNGDVLPVGSTRLSAVRQEVLDYWR